MIETQSHRKAFETLLAMGRLYYSGKRTLGKIKLRWNPVLIGPTGAGKSFLVEETARKLRAEYLKLTRGDWVVMGSSAGRPTVYRILDHAATYDRTLLHLDELDKFGNLQVSDWCSALASDLWNILDGKFAFGEYLRITAFSGREKPSVKELADRVRSRLWIVGSGTWQSVFARNRPRSTMGFSREHAGDRVAFDAIVQAESISPELLHRFGEAVFLDYPNASETAEILVSSGLAQLGQELGIPISAQDVDWTQGGMRVLESLATRLVMTRCRQQATARTKWVAPPVAEPVRGAPTVTPS